ncbi:SOS response-associated peptidase family protein [Cupriavidus necator]
MGCTLPLPASALFEPNYESGPKSVRYRIWARDQENFAIAGLWRDWPDGFTSWTMLTVNAENHPLMRRMHAPGKEKRSVVILHRDQWDDWLNCSDPEVARTFLNLYPADLMDTEPAPRASRKSKPQQASDQGNARPSVLKREAAPERLANNRHGAAQVSSPPRGTRVMMIADRRG